MLGGKETDFVVPGSKVAELEAQLSQVGFGVVVVVQKVDRHAALQCRCPLIGR